MTGTGVREATLPDVSLLRRYAGDGGYADAYAVDDTGRTRSWLMCEPLADGGTRLYFGSAVVPRIDACTGERRMDPGFRALPGFHRPYSRALLSAALRTLK